jgi:cytochrome c556
MKCVLMFVLAMTSGAVVAVAHDHATGVVKERMDLMEDMAKRMKAIDAAMKGAVDIAAIKAQAKAIADGAPHILHLFPRGSMQRPTQARSTIWKEWSDFESRTHALEAESKKLAETNERAAAVAQVRAVSRTCSGCHEKYRVRR